MPAKLKGRKPSDTEKEQNKVYCFFHPKENGFWKHPFTQQWYCKSCREMFKSNRRHFINQQIIKFLKENIWSEFKEILPLLKDGTTEWIVCRTARNSGKSWNYEIFDLILGLGNPNAQIIIMRKYKEEHTDGTINMKILVLNWIMNTFKIHDYITKDEAKQWNIPQSYLYDWIYEWEQEKQAKIFKSKYDNIKSYYRGYNANGLGVAIVGDLLLFRIVEPVVKDDNFEITDKQVKTKTETWVGSIDRYSNFLKYVIDYNPWRPTYIDKIAESALPKNWKEILLRDGIVKGFSSDRKVYTILGNIYKLNEYLKRVNVIFEKLNFHQFFEEAKINNWQYFKDNVDNMKERIFEDGSLATVKGLETEVSQKKWIKSFFKYKVMEVDEPINARTEVWGLYHKADGAVFPAEITDDIQKFDPHKFNPENINIWYAGLDWGNTGGDDTVLTLIGLKANYMKKIDRDLIHSIPRDQFDKLLLLPGSSVYVWDRMRIYNTDDKLKRNTGLNEKQRQNRHQKEEILTKLYNWYMQLNMTKPLYIQVDTSHSGGVVLTDLIEMSCARGLQNKLKFIGANKHANMGMGIKDRIDSFERMTSEKRIIVNQYFIEDFIEELSSLIWTTKMDKWDDRKGDHDPIDSFFYALSNSLFIIKEMPRLNEKIIPII